MMLAQLATLATALFTGAAIYVLFVEHPARLVGPTAHAVEHWRPSYQRATIMQASLAVLGSLLAVAAWLAGGGLSWLIAGLIFGLVVPFTLLVMWPTNQRLQDPDLDMASEMAHDLLIRWGQAHAVRVGLSFIALLLMLFGGR